MLPGRPSPKLCAMNTAQNPNIRPSNDRIFQKASFVVRIWWEHSTVAVPAMRGRIEHAASGEFVYFDSFSTLEKFIQKWTDALHETSDETQTQDKKNSGDCGGAL
jgi:hypothetical protein